jgi:hypothetical protein
MYCTYALLVSVDSKVRLLGVVTLGYKTLFRDDVSGYGNRPLAEQYSLESAVRKCNP